jgi:hypothetical protein
MRITRRRAVGATLLPLLMGLMFVTGVASGEAIHDGGDLVRAMHAKYAGSWYSTLTFVQKTTNFEADGTTKVETWYEALTCPGKLRIDFDPISAGNGILFADDTIYRVEGGKVADTKPLVHPLMVLGFDVYCDAPETTLARLRKLGFDLSTVREDTWNGVPVYVVGAKAGDERSPQFWIEKERLLFVRLLRPAGKDGKQVSEVVFDRYERAGGGWVAAEVRFGLDGKPSGKEDYSEIRTDAKLPDGLFDPQKWAAVTWRTAK